MKRYGFFLLIALICIASPAGAAHWAVDYAKSRLGFTVQWDRETFAAAFKHWTELQRGQPRPDRTSVLLKPDGSFETYDYRRLLFERDNRPVFIIE